MALPEAEREFYTYADYLSWPAEERWEIIDGAPYGMSPAPGRSHQRILFGLARVIAGITDGLPCETYIAPFDVRLPDTPESSADEQVATVVQPDISVFCRKDLLDERGAHGPPELVVEVLSPATSYTDQTVKLALYERHGVREYWIVNPEACYVMVYRLGADGRFAKPDYYRGDEEIRSEVLGGACVALARFFAGA